MPLNTEHSSPGTFDQFARAVMSGTDRRARAAALRLALASAEPVYAGAAALRNWLFDAGLRSRHRLPRPTISVGNITTGGTGKTPVVRWLAGRLRERGLRIAVLSRGYRAGGHGGGAGGALGDEQVMLDRALNAPAEQYRVVLVADPDRVRGAQEALRLRPETDVFLLDDGFQHRRVARDLDVVLVSATSPFGYGHVLPRGMLREPLRGLRRAGAFVISHADQVPPEELGAIEATLRRHNGAAPIYHAAHAHAALRTSADAVRPLEDLRGRRYFAFCGIGDPSTFFRQLESLGGRSVGECSFVDHHAYTEHDLASLRRAASAAGADVLLTTEKDWVKLEALPSARLEAPPVWRVDVEIQFRGDDGERLLDQVMPALGERRV